MTLSISVGMVEAELLVDTTLAGAHTSSPLASKLGLGISLSSLDTQPLAPERYKMFRFFFE